jgi:hypothetical protein
MRDEKAIFASIEYRWGSVAPNYGVLFENIGGVRAGGGGGLVIGSQSSLMLALDIALLRVRIRRESKTTPPMELHVIGGSKPRLLGVIRHGP